MELSDIQVELVPHVAYQESVGVRVPVSFPQCFVQLNGKRVGIYCGKKLETGYEKNKYLSFTKTLPDALQKAIADKVAALTGGVSKYDAPPPDDEHEVPSE